jgi:hypothetical protein
VGLELLLEVVEMVGDLVLFGHCYFSHQAFSVGYS